MKRTYIYIYLSFSLIGKSQNLVPNSSFESYTLCPTAASQIELSVPWSAATATSSTDYYNSCAIGTGRGVPYSNGGFQYAHTGNAYAGLILYHASEQREYLQVQLTTPLTQNKIYYVEFFTNLTNGNWSSSCNNIAANLSVTRPFTTNFGDLQSLTPHIIRSGNPIVTDTLNWVQVSGCYTAQGGEEYITIGNFFDNANTQVNGMTGIAYYYIEDVRVEEMSSACVTGVTELSATHNLRLYPNPNNGAFNIAYTFQKGSHVFELYDLMGKKINEKNLYGNEGIESISMSNITPGIYFYKVVDSNGKMLFSRKLIVSN